MAGSGDIPPAALQDAGNGVVGREVLSSGKDSEMTDLEKIEAFEHWLDAVEMIQGEKHPHRDIAALARIGAAVQPIVNEIKDIMETYHEQEDRGYIDSPGGLEHMGDVWRLLNKWDKAIPQVKP